MYEPPKLNVPFDNPYEFFAKELEMEFSNPKLESSLPTAYLLFFILGFDRKYAWHIAKTLECWHLHRFAQMLGDGSVKNTLIKDILIQFDLCDSAITYFEYQHDWWHEYLYTRNILEVTM